MSAPRFATLNAAFDHIRDVSSKWRLDGETSGRCVCPVHDGAKHPNLKVTMKEDRILLHCHSHGCEFGAIAAAFGLTERDLFKPGHRAVEAVRMKREDARSDVRHTAAAAARRKLLDEAEATPEQLKLKPPPVTLPSGIVTGIQLAVMQDPCHVQSFRAVGNGEEWARLNVVERALLADWTWRNTPAYGRMGVALGLGTAKPNGEWVAPPPFEVREPYVRRTLADMTFEPAEVVAHGIAFRGKLGIFHGPAGQGKSTLFANVASRITTGRPFAGHPTVAGDVLVYAEDLDTWHTVMHRTDGDRKKLVVLDRWPIPEEALDDRVVMLVADTFAYATQASGGDPDKSVDVDAILRPLSDIAKRHNIGVVVLDHEPWATDGKKAETVPRPRNSTAKVATCDYVIRVSLTSEDDDAETLVRRGVKVRVGLDIPKAVVYNEDGDPVEGHADVDNAEPDDDWVIEHLTAEPTAVRPIVERSGRKQSGKTITRFRQALDRLAAENAGVQRTLKNPNRPRSGANPFLYAWRPEE